MLELRLAEHDSQVDAFVLVESAVTFRGTPKPLYFAANRDRFARYLPKIRHIIVDDMPTTMDPWSRERWQRNALRRGLAGAVASDTVLVSDVDEILRPAAIADAASRPAFCFFSQDLFYFYLNWRATTPLSRLWTKAFAAPWAVVQAMPDLTVPREVLFSDYLAIQNLDPRRNVIDHAGWHFSWTGGVDRLRLKMDSFSHSEAAMQRWNNSSTLASAIGSQRFFYDNERLENLSISPGFPPTLRHNEASYADRGLLSPNRAEGASFYERPRTELFAALAKLGTTAEALRTENRVLAKRLDVMQASTSWRITAPLRRCVDHFRERRPFFDRLKR